MKITSHHIIILTICTLLTITSCSKNNNLYPSNTTPRITQLSISGEGKIHTITIFFNQGIYATSNKSGGLNQNNFLLEMDCNEISIYSYVVTHVACQRNAKIRIVLSEKPTDNKIITIQPSTNLSLFNFEGKAMSISEKASITIKSN